MRRSCFPLLILLFGFLLIFGWLGMKGLRIYRAAQSLQERQAAVEELIGQGVTNIDPDDAEALLTGVRGDIQIIKNESALFMPIMPYLGWLPRLGPTLVAAPQLLTMADAGTEAAAYALRGLKPAIKSVQENSGIASLSGAIGELSSAAPDLRQAEFLLEQVAAARAELPNEEALPWTIRQTLPQADKYLPLALDGLALSRILPALAGADSPRRYLIIAQNQDELRPTGGFISGAGIVTVLDGQIMDLQFIDANIIDDWANKPYDAPPAPLEQFMGIQLFLFRDANFWADFPTSAEKAMELYSYGQDVTLPDGAIAVNQAFLINLITVVGVVEIPELNEQVTPANVESWIQTAWGTGEEGALGSILDRKQFIPLLANALRQKLESAPGAIDPFALATMAQEAALAKDLQIYVRDPAAASALRDVGWDGSMPVDAGSDTVMVVETNIGYNKSSVHMERHIAYTAQLQPNGSATAQMSFTFSNSLSPNGEECRHELPRYTLDLVYLDLTYDCYWSYSRYYHPAGAQLLSAPSYPIPGQFFITEQGWDGVVRPISDPTGLTTFEDVWLIDRGKQASRQYQIQLPNVTQTTAEGNTLYQLRLLKQAGVAPYPAQITVITPEDSRLLHTEPEAEIDGNAAIFNATLDKDLTFSVTYR